jgi:uncharacterized protein with GYD domain
MATFLALGNWTREGANTYKETLQRADAAKEEMEKVASSSAPCTDPQGPYDVCFFMEAADEKTATAALLWLGALGNLRTTTLRAFTRPEMATIIEKAG